MTPPAPAHAELIVARILVRQAVPNVATMAELRALARNANAAGVWNASLRATFTARRAALEANT